MSFEQNPFQVLNVSIYDTAATINERADDLSFTEPDEKAIEQARTTLLNPRKRIAAEVQWFVSKGALSSDSILKWLTVIDKNFSEHKPETLRTKINRARGEAKLPVIKDVGEIKAELKNIRYEIRKMIQDELRTANQKIRVNFANRFVDEVLEAESFGVVVEDFFEVYRLEMNSLFEQTSNQIVALLPKIKINAHPKFIDELTAAVKTFAYARRPLDKFSIALGANDCDDSEEIFYAVREVAVTLFNEKYLIRAPLRIMRMLEENFSHLPKLVELIRKDIKFLQQAEEQQPTKIFLDVKEEFELITESMERDLHFEKGFERANLYFYETVFKVRYEITLNQLIIRRDMKPAEWRFLNFIAAVIYAQMGAALTWANRADLALELYQKALSYAETSGDAKLIARIKKDISKFVIIKRPVLPAKSSGCFTAVAIFCLLLIMLTF